MVLLWVSLFGVFIICSISKLYQFSKFILKVFRCISHPLSLISGRTMSWYCSPALMDSVCPWCSVFGITVQFLQNHPGTPTSLWCCVPSLFSVCAVLIRWDKTSINLLRIGTRKVVFWGDFVHVYDSLAEYTVLNWKSCS